MPSYLKDSGAVGEIVRDVMVAHHGDLDEAEVRVDVLLAFPGENDKEGSSPVTLHGYPCAAIIKINSARHRLQGLADATITLDARLWGTYTDTAKRALIDHELTHLKVCRDKDYQIKSDDAGRPKLKMALHDIQVGVFTSIIDRYGDQALDGQMVKVVVDDWGQTVWDWADTRAKYPGGKRAKAKEPELAAV